LATFSEEEDKLYEEGFDSLYMTGNDKKEPVQSPLFPQPNVDQKVKSTKKSVVDPSDESEDDLYFYKKSSLSSQGKAGHKIHPLDLIDTESDADQKNPFGG
jgi:hypothetical protein